MKKVSYCFWFLCLFLSLLGVLVLEPSQHDHSGDSKKEVPFVASQTQVVKAMLELAEVKSSDIVYDLGCGDGRIVIMAAQKYGARGVGVDVDPELIRRSKENAYKAGVSDYVEFLLQDFNKTRVSQASVVTLFLRSDINIKLRPKLIRELKPGSRVVSNFFRMGDWQPDRIQEVPSITLSFMVYCWIVPAEVRGTWRCETTILGEERHYEICLEQKFQKISGKAHNSFEELPITAASLEGDQISFVFTDMIAGQAYAMCYKGFVNGETISGKVQIQADSSATGKYESTSGRTQDIHLEYPFLFVRKHQYWMDR
jgi:SAM-dependent methyltransferase